ncbi:hypothetical protein ABMA27_010302 [Loxostege sticticalis]|uniref:RNA-directed DNA polymerase n=1 Tax=Loxostege sticticalis TaxID=481309 RepID=A0ABR3H5B6_LOXSC
MLGRARFDCVTDLSRHRDEWTLLPHSNLSFAITTNDAIKMQYEAYVAELKSYTEILELHRDKLTKVSDPPSSGTESATSALPVNISVTCDRGGSADLGKLKYDGKTCVRAFIQRATEFCEARNISDSKALSYATEIFTGDALHWFRNVKNRVSSWSELITLLQNDFTRSDYDYRLIDEIRSRTQGESENITVYLSIMSGLFSRLSKPKSEDEKLEVILHNIRPCYASTLASAGNIQTLDSLQTICRNYENIQARLANFHEPSGPTADTLAPEFAYYRMSPEKQRILVEQVDEILALDVVEPCESAWSSPVLLVTKKNGQPRFCLDKNHSQPTAAHLGIFKTYNRLLLRYYWPGMHKDVVKTVGACQKCLEYKTQNH